MSYEAVYLYNNKNEFVGVAIKKADAPKLHSLNIWSSSDEEVADFRKTITGLNEENALRAFWPEAHDPEVGELVDDPNWEQLALHEEKVPDWEHSTIVDDEFGGIDQEKSTIVFKKALVPDPSEAQARYFKAQEIVARRRAREESGLPATD
jgi:hypothetical protein